MQSALRHHRPLALALALALVIVSTSASPPSRPLPASPVARSYLNQTSRVFKPRNKEDFWERFESGSLNYNRWFTAGYWLNPQPFNAGFDPSYWSMTWKTLVLHLRKKHFRRGDWDAPYTAGELRSQAKYSSGCYSVCMKPARPSGVSSSFYIQDFGKNYKGQTTISEIDIEFVGVDTTKVQSNFFSRIYDPDANSGSGNEEMHELGFNAADRYAAYSFKWTKGRIDWWVNDWHLRGVTSREKRLPNDGTKMRIAASVWCVNKQAEEWAGKLDPNFQDTEARYQWVWHQTGDDCVVKMSCGKNGDPDYKRK